MQNSLQSNAKSAKKSYYNTKSDGFASRSLVLRLVGQVVAGKRLDVALADIQQSSLRPEDIAFARLLLMQTLRFTYAAEPVALAHAARRPSGLDRLILILGVVQLYFLDLAPHAVVAETVALAPPKSRGFINACLRKIADEWQSEPDQAAVREAAIARNAPEWMIARLQRDWGADEAKAILQAHATIAPLDLAFVSDVARKKWLKSAPTVLDAQLLPHGAVRLISTSVKALKGFGSGQYWVQDAAAQIPVWLLRQHMAGKKVLDICAAPGGKTAQMHSFGAQVVALDRDIKRMGRLKENMKRLGFAPKFVLADATDWAEETDFDVVFLDAPCSATGTMRRHPDMLLRDNDPRLHDTQRELFEQACHLLKPQGILVYSVCSLRPAEGAGLMEQLVDNLPLKSWAFAPEDREKLAELIRMDRLSGSPAHQIQTLPCDAKSIGGMDGFFIAAYQFDSAL